MITAFVLRPRRWQLLLPLLSACSYMLPPLSPRVAELPPTLAGTGLDDSALAYRPSYELWSDGAQKRRFIRLPDGVQIDTSNMDDWSFPVGTRVWKEFTRDGKRVETRFIQRMDSSPDGWVAAAYVWDADQREARLLPDGADDALETAHDVPSARACPACHAARSSYVLGFSALQLAHAAQDDRELTLQKLTAAGLLSQAPTSAPAIPGSESAQAALGYLHANCGNCHNAARPPSAEHVRPHSSLDLWVPVGLQRVEDSGTYRSARSEELLTPGQPDESLLWLRMQGRRFMKRRMPPIASEDVDHHGSEIVGRWISELRSL